MRVLEEALHNQIVFLIAFIAPLAAWLCNTCRIEILKRLPNLMKIDGEMVKQSERYRILSFVSLRDLFISTWCSMSHNQGRGQWLLSWLYQSLGSVSVKLFFHKLPTLLPLYQSSSLQVELFLPLYS
jgi:hypothetical protein